MALRYNTENKNNVGIESTLNTPGMNSPVYGQGEVASAYRLSDTSNLYEPQRKNNFEIAILGLEDIFAAGQTTASNNPLVMKNVETPLRLMVYEAPIPHFKQDEIEIKRGNSKIYFAGVPTFDGGSIKVYDTIGADTKDILMAWQNLSYNIATDKVGLASDYKKTAYLTEYTTDWQAVRTWKLEGCWLKGLSEDNATWQDGAYKTISADIRYDRAYIDYTDVNTN